MRAEDAEQLAALWTRSQTDVAAFLRSVAPAEQVPDLLQQVAVKLVRNFDRYDHGRPFTAWAIGIAKNELLAWRRKQATDRHRFDDDIVQRVAEAFSRAATQEEPRAEALRECLEDLEGRARKALDLHYGEGLKTADVAHRLKVKAGALRMLLCRAREAIRRCVQQRLGVPAARAKGGS